MAESPQHLQRLVVSSQLIPDCANAVVTGIRQVHFRPETDVSNLL